MSLNAYEFDTAMKPLLEFYRRDDMSNELQMVYFEKLSNCDAGIFRRAIVEIIDAGRSRRDFPSPSDIRKVYASIKYTGSRGAPGCKNCIEGWVCYRRWEPSIGAEVLFSAPCAYCRPRSEYPQVIYSNGKIYRAGRLGENGKFVADMEHPLLIESAQPERFFLGKLHENNNPGGESREKDYTERKSAAL